MTRAKQSIGGMIGGAASLASGNPLGALAVGTGLYGLLSGGFKAPDRPDYVSETAGEFGKARRRLSERQGRDLDRVEDSVAARGATGSGGVAEKEAVYDASAGAMADLAADEADALAEASNRAEEVRYADERAARDARVGAVSDMVSTWALRKSLGDVDEVTGTESVAPAPAVSAPAVSVPTTASMVAEPWRFVSPDLVRRVAGFANRPL